MKFNGYMLVDKYERLVGDCARIRHDGNMPYLEHLRCDRDASRPDLAPHRVVRVIIDEIGNE